MGMEDSEKFTRSIQKLKERMLQLRAERAHTIFLEDPPPMFQHSRSKCTARTLEGRPCQFFAVTGCSGFCKKHFSMM